MMIARVTTSDGTIYDSAIFASKYNGWHSKVIVFDQYYSKLIELPIWKAYNTLALNLVIMDYDTSNWAIDSRKFKSYWRMKNIFSLVENQKYDAGILSEAKSIQDDIKVEEWNDVKSQSDAESFMNVSGAFHDAYIERLVVNNDDYEILFNTSWDKYILLKCKEVSKSNLEELDGFFEAAVKFQDGKIALSFDEYKVIEARSISWKLFVQHKYFLNDSDFSLENNKLIFHDKKGKEKTIDMNTVDNEVLAFKENNIIGIINYSEHNGSYDFIDNKAVQNLRYYKRKTETEEAYKLRFYKLKNILEQKNYRFHENDYEGGIWGDEEYEQRYGENLLTIDYSPRLIWFDNVEKILVISFGYLALWFVLKILNEGLEWIIFYIFGLGFSLYMIITVTIASFFNNKRVKTQLRIYRDHIMMTGNFKNFSINTNDIVDVFEKRNKIYICTKNGKKHKIITTSENRKQIYEVIKSTFKGN